MKLRLRLKLIAKMLSQVLVSFFMNFITINGIYPIYEVHAPRNAWIFFSFYVIYIKHVSDLIFIFKYIIST